MNSKVEIRAAAIVRRAREADREEKSRRIWDQVQRLPELQSAEWIGCYLDIGNEVATYANVEKIAREKRSQVAIPFCENGALRLFRFESGTELSPGSFGVLEPRPEFRTRTVSPEKLSCILVPGVAFDRKGGRIGYGKGYYDRLLNALSPSAVRIGLAFASQLLAEDIPVEPHDAFLDIIVTEDEVIRCAPLRNGELA